MGPVIASLQLPDRHATYLGSPIRMHAAPKTEDTAVDRAHCLRLRPNSALRFDKPVSATQPESASVLPFATVAMVMSGALAGDRLAGDRLQRL